MNKQGLREFIELKRKQRSLIETIEDIQQKLESFDYQETADIVSCGRKRHRTIGRVIVRGYDHRSYTRLNSKLLSKRLELAAVENEIELQQYEAELFIVSELPFEEHEIRLLLMELLPCFDMIRTWDEVAQSYLKRHNMQVEPDALRIKLQRFLKGPEPRITSK